MGHSAVTAALIEAGADVDGRGKSDGATPLFVAGCHGHVDIVRQLLRANANPLLLTGTSSPGVTSVALDPAAQNGHSCVVRELIQHVGLEGCAGASGGVIALEAATRFRHWDVMAMLTDAGVVDTGLALVAAARWGGEAAVKFLLQQRQLVGSPGGLDGYVNFCNRGGCTALFRSIDFSKPAGDQLNLISPRVVRLLIDAGADTASDVRVTTGGVVYELGTPLAFTINNCLLKGNSTEEQLHRLEAVRRLLLKVKAVHAVSWLRHNDVPSIAHVAGDTSRPSRKTPVSSTQLASMLPILRRRKRGSLLAPLFRYASYP